MAEFNGQKWGTDLLGLLHKEFGTGKNIALHDIRGAIYPSDGTDPKIAMPKLGQRVDKDLLNEINLYVWGNSFDVGGQQYELLEISDHPYVYKIKRK